MQIAYDRNGNKHTYDYRFKILNKPGQDAYGFVYVKLFDCIDEGWVKSGYASWHGKLFIFSMPTLADLSQSCAERLGMSLFISHSLYRVKLTTPLMNKHRNLGGEPPF
jgi:hypothetical protein